MWNQVERFFKRRTFLSSILVGLVLLLIGRFFTSSSDTPLNNWSKYDRLGLLRDDVPPLSFSVQLEDKKVRKSGVWIFKKNQTASGFCAYYANMTKTPVGSVCTRIRLKRPAEYFILLHSANEVITIDSVKTVKDDGFSYIKLPQGELSSTPFGYSFVQPIGSDKIKKCEFWLISDNPISLSDIDVEVTCAEGDFVKQTPMQFDAIKK